MKKGVTLIECLVVAAILATLVALLAPAVFAIRENTETGNDSAQPQEVRATKLLHTVRHDDHLWVLGWSFDGGNHATHFVHHPDCPCHVQTAEAHE